MTATFRDLIVNINKVSNQMEEEIKEKYKNKGGKTNVDGNSLVKLIKETIKKHKKMGNIIGGSILRILINNGECTAMFQIAARTGASTWERTTILMDFQTKH